MSTTAPRARFARPYSVDRLDALLTVADGLENVFELPGGDVTETSFYRAFFLAQQCTGLSTRQLLSLQWEAICPGGAFHVDFQLSREALFAVGRIVSSSRPQIFMVPDERAFRRRLKLVHQFAAWERKGGES